MKFHSACAIAVLATSFALPASAVVTYHYSGHNGPNSEGTSAYPYVGRYASMTFDFTVTGPLAANLHNVDILATVLSWEASGGSPLSTITSTDPNPYKGGTTFSANRLRLSTDASGNITTYNIVASARVAAEPATEAYFLFERLQLSSTQSDETFQGYNIKKGGSAFVSATCSGAGACGGSTTFGILAAPPPNVSAVPEPSTWELWLAGMVGIGGIGRARRRTSTGVTRR